jgi:AcrR family transcriptional regulator
VGRIAGVTPEETRERLLDAAARVFEHKGYEGATIAQIAREAGLTSGAIYAHYDSKADLLADALRVHMDRATASVLPPGASAEVPDVLVALGHRLRTRDDEANALLLEALLTSRRDTEFAEVLSKALTRREKGMAELVRCGQQEGEIWGDVSPRSAARFALMLSLGSMLVQSLDLPETDPDEWSAFLQRLVAAYTTNPPTAP